MMVHDPYDNVRIRVINNLLYLVADPEEGPWGPLTPLLTLTLARFTDV